jgi:long-subunit acyl-CoA synthetase (AMP-forming)
MVHGNLLHQTFHRWAPSRPYKETEPLPGESTVSLLPVWHSIERSFENLDALSKEQGSIFHISLFGSFAMTWANINRNDWCWLLVPRVFCHILA